MTSIEQCPGTSEARTLRSNIKKCPTLDNYHCLKTEGGQLRELCTSPIWIEAGKFKKETILIYVNFVFYRKLQPWFAYKKKEKQKTNIKLRLRKHHSFYLILYFSYYIIICILSIWNDNETTTCKRFFQENVRYTV